MTSTGSDTQISVWDPLVRFGHWALVAAFAIAYISGDEGGEPSAWHEWTGYIAGGIVVWRVLWGLTGTRYARFSDFVVGPAPQSPISAASSPATPAGMWDIAQPAER